LCAVAINDDKTDTLTSHPAFQNLWICHW